MFLYFRLNNNQYSKKNTIFAKLITFLFIRIITLYTKYICV